MLSVKFRNVIQKYLPEEAVDYCCDLWESHRFDFKVTRRRATKLGDYRYYFQTGRHCITVNGDLNPYSFLITYLHEVAHLKTNLAHGRHVKPHGEEWKENFSSLLLAVRDVFPEEILKPLDNYIKNPKASSCSDAALLKALNGCEKGEPTVYLSEVSLGESFIFNKKIYVKEQRKRTRSVCCEVSTGRKFLIPDAAPIYKVEE
ncbi:transcription elongation protein SprT [Cytophagaceae bacterium ABcell3]|nr:transcription elongation protein SprT [Cytophagaceae bacterium ABcell3]